MGLRGGYANRQSAVNRQSARGKQIGVVVSVNVIGWRNICSVGEDVGGMPKLGQNKKSRLRRKIARRKNTLDLDFSNQGQRSSGQKVSQNLEDGTDYLSVTFGRRSNIFSIDYLVPRRLTLILVIKVNGHHNKKCHKTWKMSGS